MPSIRFLRRVLCVLMLCLATAIVMVPTKSVVVNATQTCCAKMAEQSDHCPPPAPSPSESCCNLPACLHLFLQTRELDLMPASSDLEWANFVTHAVKRPQRPAVPPPRV